jgi:hypothetical protein
MNLEQVFILVERLRKGAIGEPKRIVDKGVLSIKTIPRRLLLS